MQLLTAPAPPRTIGVERNAGIRLPAVPRREGGTEAFAVAALLAVIGDLTAWLRHEIDSGQPSTRSLNESTSPCSKSLATRRCDGETG